MAKKPIIVTTTLYHRSRPSELVRMQPALRGLEAALHAGIDVVMIDGGSDDKFLSQLNQAGVHVVTKKDGTLGMARRAAIEEAQNLGADVLIYTELEKDSFISALPGLLEKFSSNQHAMMIPERNDMDSYPAFQRNTEHKLNGKFTELTGSVIDVAFGPRIWKRELSSYFLNYGGDYGDSWDSIFIPVIRMIADGVRIQTASIDFVYPPEQLEHESMSHEMAKKRLTQLTTISEAMEREWQQLSKVGLEGVGIAK